MVLFSLATIWLVGFHRTGSLPWVCGALAAFCSLFTMGAGLFASAVVCALAGVRILTQPSSWRQNWPAIAVGLVALGLGLALRVTVPYHEMLKAHSISEFLVTLGRYLAWPWIVLPPYTAFNLFPLLMLAWLYLRHREARGPAEEMVLGVSLWALLQAVASAYARGGQTYPQWRYMDLSCFLMIANVLSLVLLGSRHRERLPLKRYFRAASLLWTLACALGLGLLCWRAWTVDIPLRQMYHRLQLLTTRAYLATGDRQYLEVRRPEYLARYRLAATPASGQGIWWIWLNAPGSVRCCLHVRVTRCNMTPESVGCFTTNGIDLARPNIPGNVSWSSFARERFRSPRALRKLACSSKQTYLPGNRRGRRSARAWHVAAVARLDLRKNQRHKASPGPRQSLAQLPDQSARRTVQDRGAG